MGPIRSQNRRKIEVASRMRFCSVFWSHRVNIKMGVVGDHFPSKVEKWHPERPPKIDAEKVSNNNAKRLQNDAKMDGQIYDCSCFFEKGENALTFFFYSFRGSGHLEMHHKSMHPRLLAISGGRCVCGLWAWAVADSMCDAGRSWPL